MYRQPPPYRPPPSPMASPKECSPTKEDTPPVPPRRRSSEKIRLIESNDSVIVNSKDNYVSRICLYFYLANFFMDLFSNGLK